VAQQRIRELEELNAFLTQQQQQQQQGAAISDEVHETTIQTAEMHSTNSQESAQAPSSEALQVQLRAVSVVDWLLFTC